MESNQLLDDCSDHSSHRPCSQGSLLLAGRVGDNPENEVEQSLQQQSLRKTKLQFLTTSRYKSTYQHIRRVRKKHLAKVQLHPINLDTKGVIESIRTNGCPY